MTTDTTREPVLGVVPDATRASGFLLLRRVSYTLVLTPKRMLFAKMTRALQMESIRQARAEAKAAGKGALATWGAQISGALSWFQRYADMSPQDILAETPDNFALARSDILKLRVDEHRTLGDEERSRRRPLLRLTTSSHGKLKLELGLRCSSEHHRLLQQWFKGQLAPAADSS